MKLSSLVVGCRQLEWLIFLPETLVSGTGLYIRPRAEEILSCDLQALTSHAVSPFWVVVPKISRLWARPLAPYPGQRTFLFDDRVAAAGSRPRAASLADFLKASL